MTTYRAAVAVAGGAAVAFALSAATVSHFDSWWGGLVEVVEVEVLVFERWVGSLIDCGGG